MNNAMISSLLPEKYHDLPPFRIKQLFHAVFVDLIADWSQATTLPLALRQGLNDGWPLGWPLTFARSKDGRTAKAALTLADGSVIEAVLMRYPGRNSVCVSSQAGCAMGCKFCATGQMGFKRNLSVWEIVSQVLVFARLLKEKGERIQSVVFMGMGEPFLNYDNVLAAIRLLNDKNGFNLGMRHMSVSTCGIVPGIEQFTHEDLEVNLAISLHAPNNELRNQLMPINQTYPLENIMSAIRKYADKTRRKVMFEYLLLDGVNDSDECARELAGLMNHKLFMINIIPYNQTGRFKPSATKRIQAFMEILRKNKVNVTQRFSFGQDIKAACGQLAGQTPNKT